MWKVVKRKELLIGVIKNPTSFSFERNANYNAFQILNELYKDTDYKRIAELNHLYNMFLGYYMKRGRVISPIDTTFKKMCINTRVCISKIPFEDKLREGMPISVDDYQKFFSVYDDKNLSDLSYDDVMKKVKSMK